MPFSDQVQVDDTTTFKLVGVDRINPLSEDTTGSAIYDCRAGQACDLAYTTITNERSLLGAVAENAVPAAVQGVFYWAGQKARRPDQTQISMGNVTGASANSSG